MAFQTVGHTPDVGSRAFTHNHGDVVQSRVVLLIRHLQLNHMLPGGDPVLSEEVDRVPCNTAGGNQERTGAGSHAELYGFSFYVFKHAFF